MTPAMQALRNHISRGDRLYLIWVDQTRNRKVRRYRVLRAEGDRIVNDTATVCELIGQEWEPGRGTYNASETYSSQDAAGLAIAIRHATSTPTVNAPLPSIFML